MVFVMLDNFAVKNRPSAASFKEKKAPQIQVSMICSKTYQQSVVIHYLLLRNPPNPSTLRIRRIILRHSVVCKGGFKKYRRVSWKCAYISALYLGCCFPTSPRLIQSMRLAVSNCKKDPGLDQLGNPLLLDTFLLLIICIMDDIRSNFLAPYWKFS